ncbi:hypothetical protein CNR27_06685 [Luteimonas chenhongjianii]|uniref:Uncharacterized protein n=1 Tax=Luteimonas chenhongjianii TaxID=2006110 RepID=A0A290XDS8_9GAMM|nr:hypothetical protein CNR27_06685 [Luteimonas chenhongjianii]
MSVLTAAGCASQSPRLASVPAPQPAPSASRIAVDSTYVGRVNQTALRRGLQVHWINPPMRRARQD